METAKSTAAFARMAQRALRQAVQGVIADHRKTGDPLVVWRGGKVRTISTKRVKR
jgi:hypothetical protein